MGVDPMSTLRRWLLVVQLSTLLAVGFAAIVWAIGPLDTTFDSDGKVTTDFGGLDGASALAIQSDGKLVVAGSSSTENTSDFAIARYRPANQPPTDLGRPALSLGSSTPNQGSFSLSWTASVDPDGDPVTYTLQHKEANDADFSDVVTGWPSTTYSFPEGAPEAEGTWTYRVQASDGSLSSGFSAVSDSVTVDRTSPRPPPVYLPLVVRRS